MLTDGPPAAGPDAGAVAARPPGGRAAAAAMPAGVHADEPEVRALPGRAGRPGRRGLGRRGRRRRWSATPGSRRPGSTTSTSCPSTPARGSARPCSTWSRRSGPTASACGSSRCNEPARAFYARHGLVELERTDGSANEEQAPDIRMAWPGAEPLAFLRGLIDEVDAAARRPAGPPRGADPRRPGPQGRPIAATRSASTRSPPRWPSAPPPSATTGWRRIVHAIITESLDAAAELGARSPPGTVGGAGAMIGSVRVALG